MASPRHLGRIHFLAIGGSVLPVKCEVSSSLSTTESDITANCKSDNGAAFILQGTTEAVINVTINLDYETDAGAYTWKELHTDKLAGTTLAFVWGTGIAGDQMISGNGIWKNLNITAEDESAVQGTVDLAIQGAYTLADAV